MHADQNRPTTAYSYACHARTFQSSDILPGYVHAQ
nr:MAG TPA: hypothetical protein [Caudoviricetes sp.]